MFMKSIKNSIDISKFNFDYNYNSIINCVNESKKSLNILLHENNVTTDYIFEQRFHSVNEKKTSLLIDFQLVKHELT